MLRRVGQVNSDQSHVKPQRMILGHARTKDSHAFKCVDSASSCLRQRRSSVLKFVRVFEKVHCFSASSSIHQSVLVLTRSIVSSASFSIDQSMRVFEGPLINKIFRSYNRAFENGMRLDW